MYLVPFSLAFLPLVPKNLLDDGRDLLYVLFFLITNAVLVSAVSHNAREVALVEGKYPQDLLTQYYHGSRDVSSVARLLAHLEVTPPHSVIYCDIHLFPALRYYWVVAGRNAAQLQCLDGGRLFPLRVNPNELRFPAADLNRLQRRTGCKPVPKQHGYPCSAAGDANGGWTGPRDLPRVPDAGSRGLDAKEEK